MLIITDKDENKRIDKYLVEQTEYTRSKIQKMIDNQNILVNGQSIKANYLLKKQDVISLEELTEDVDIEPENIDAILITLSGIAGPVLIFVQPLNVPFIFNLIPSLPPLTLRLRKAQIFIKNF